MSLSEAKQQQIQQFLQHTANQGFRPSDYSHAHTSSDISTPLHHQMSQAMVAAGIQTPQEGAYAQSMDDVMLEEFKSQVRLWMDLDSQIKRLTQEVRERKKVQKVVHEKILDFMNRHNIEDLNTRDGILRFKKRYVKESLSQKTIRERLKEKLGQSPQAEAIMKEVFDARAQKEKTSLRRIAY